MRGDLAFRTVGIVPPQSNRPCGAAGHAEPGDELSKEDCQKEWGIGTLTGGVEVALFDLADRRYLPLQQGLLSEVKSIERVSSCFGALIAAACAIAQQDLVSCLAVPF